MNIQIIENISFEHQTEFDLAVGADDGSDPVVVARCWDFYLAEKLADAISDYMENK